jgi:hypothetical protein
MVQSWTIRVLQALQTTDHHAVVTSANRQPWNRPPQVGKNQQGQSRQDLPLLLSVSAYGPADFAKI